MAYAIIRLRTLRARGAAHDERTSRKSKLMKDDDKPVTCQSDQIEALLAAKLDVQNKLNEIFEEERKILTEVLQNMMRIDRELTAVTMIAPMHEVFAPLNRELQTDLLEQIWTTMQDEENDLLEERNGSWTHNDTEIQDPPSKGAA